MPHLAFALAVVIAVLIATASIIRGAATAIIAIGSSPLRDAGSLISSIKIKVAAAIVVIIVSQARSSSRGEISARAACTSCLSPRAPWVVLAQLSIQLSVLPQGSTCGTGGGCYCCCSVSTTRQRPVALIHCISSCTLLLLLLLLSFHLIQLQRHLAGR